MQLASARAMEMLRDRRRAKEREESWHAGVVVLERPARPTLPADPMLKAGFVLCGDDWPFVYQFPPPRI